MLPYNKLLSSLMVCLFGLSIRLIAQHDSTVTTTVETRLAPTDTAPDGGYLEPMRSIITTTTNTTVTTKTVVYGKWHENRPGGQPIDSTKAFVPVDTAAILKLAKWRKRNRLWVPPDSIKRVHGLFATFTAGYGTNWNGGPFVGGPDIRYPERLSGGLSKSFLLTYSRPKGFSIGFTLVEMQRSAPTVVDAVTASRLRVAGLIGGGRMASARNYNVQFLLMGGLALAGQRFWVHYADRDLEVSSQRPCLLLRPEFEVRLLPNLQLACGVQALTSFFDTTYEVMKSPNHLDFLQPYSDGKGSFFFYDVHMGLSYLLVK